MRRLTAFFLLTVWLWAVAPAQTLRADSVALKALADLRGKASSGDPKALYDLASLLERGYRDIPHDTRAADSLFLASAEAGYPAARNYVGFKFYRGDGYPRDVHKALEWIQKAAEQGDAKAANNLGWLLMEGDGVEHDCKKAAYWLGKATDAGLPVAMSQLGDLYRTGRGVERDSLRALALYEKSLAGGFPEAEPRIIAMEGKRLISLPGTCALSKGLEYKRMGGDRLAVMLFERAAEEGVPQAYTLLGDAASRGEGLPYSHDKATGYYLRGARLGDPSAMFILGELLEMFPDSLDILDATDEEKNAAGWLEKAGAAGVTDAATATRRLYDPR